MSSASFMPSRPKSLMPLSIQGLCDAEMTIPAENFARARQVGNAGSRHYACVHDSAPAARRPPARAPAIQALDSRVSWPISTRACPVP